jgi:cytochrome c biogenesis protein CcmG/thiol:disulfide interchange protein DsbE
MTEPDPPAAGLESAQSEEAAPRQRRLGWWIGVVGGLGFIVLLTVALSSRFGEDPGLIDSPLIGKPAPSFDLEYLEQPGSLSLEELRGEIVVVNFWASWCIPCRAEHPVLTGGADAYRAAGVRFVGISYQDEKNDAIGFLDRFGRGYDYLVDPGTRTAIAFGVFGVPETFFIDTDGTVAGKVTGELTAGVLTRTLDNLLAGLPADS